MGKKVNWSPLKCASKSQMKGRTFYELAFFPIQVDSFRQVSWLTFFNSEIRKWILPSTNKSLCDS